MQNFGSGSSDRVSTQEAQEVLKAWTDRQQARGVDPSVGSVQSLAAGLGVSEDEVRRMLEDIRVQHRSHQLAAGMLAQEQRQRKRLDVTAAIFAAVAIVVVALVAGGIFFWGHSGSSGPENLPPVNVPPPIAGLPVPATPVTPVDDSNAVISIQGDDGSQTIVDQHGIHIQKKDGTFIDMRGSRASDAMQARIDAQQAELDKLKATLKEPYSAADQAKVKELETKIEAMRNAKKSLPKLFIGK